MYAETAMEMLAEVVKLRDDLRTGDLALNMFAADLYEVLMKRGEQPIYENPETFFSLTYPTHSLRQLVRDVALRLAGKNDKAVRQLELTYGGGKTHTLITLLHLMADPDSLPDLPAVNEFISDIGQKPMKAVVAGLCFDKLDAETGMDVRGPDGSVRCLLHPWSVLAWQIAGAEGLKLLNAEGKEEERSTAPAENVLYQLLAIPGKNRLGVLILIDEVLMYAREKATLGVEWRGKIMDFFQYLTQAAVKSKRCCIVASLLASDPKKSDTLGRELQNDLYDIFQRQREQAIEPVAKEDVAEVLRRRFFTPDSIANKEEFKQHVIAALKGITMLDEQSSKDGAQTEQKFLNNFPFHPDLTEVLYGKWTNLDRFQRTRGVLRTFALALREAEKWDQNPLIAWEIVNEEVKKQQRDGNVDPARAQTLRINIDVAKGRIPESIRQAYCIVVTVSQQNENQAFKINVSDEAHFTTIKNDKRARIQDSAITPEAVLPDGPYSLWTGNEKSRRVKDLSGAFAQMPRLPKMLLHVS